MAKRSQNLASMSVDALLQMRDDIGRVLGKKADELKTQLSRLGNWGSTDGRTTKAKGVRGGRGVKGRKVAPKYRGPNGETWAGRGARPRWLEALVKQGHKREEYLIERPAKAAASRKQSTAKRSKRKSKSK
jgi:DNA-binding protein H-NS